MEARDIAKTATADHVPYCAGRHGWMLEASLDEVLASVLSTEMYHDNFGRLRPFGREIATELIERLPPDYLATERQNDAPTMGSTLTGIARHPNDLRAFGYLVGPGRCDERITLEGVLLRAESGLRLCTAYERRLTSCDCEKAYGLLTDVVGVDDALCIPHEIEPWYGHVPGSDEIDDHHDKSWYRLWWD